MNSDYMAAIVLGDMGVQFIPKAYQIKRYPDMFHYIDEISPDLNIHTPHVYEGRYNEETGQWTIEYSPTRVQEWKDNILKETRSLRNTLLAECDWTQVLDVPFTVEQKQAWCQYRSALRDLPQYIISHDCYDNIPWPAPPS